MSAECDRCGVIDPETVKPRETGERLCGLCAVTLAGLRARKVTR